MPKLFIKNQLNNNQKIEFCLANEEYALEPNEETDIEIKDGDCLYFDVVREEIITINPEQCALDCLCKTCTHINGDMCLKEEITCDDSMYNGYCPVKKCSYYVFLAQKE